MLNIPVCEEEFVNISFFFYCVSFPIKFSYYKNAQNKLGEIVHNTISMFQNEDYAKFSFSTNKEVSGEISKVINFEHFKKRNYIFVGVWDYKFTQEYSLDDNITSFSENSKVVFGFPSPDKDFAHLYLKIYVYRKYFDKYQQILEGIPFVIFVNKNCTNKQLFESIYYKISHCLTQKAKRSNKILPFSSLPIKIFRLLLVDSKNPRLCAKCSEKNCFGCPVLYDDSTFFSNNIFQNKFVSLFLCLKLKRLIVPKYLKMKICNDYMTLHSFAVSIYWSPENYATYIDPDKTISQRVHPSVKQNLQKSLSFHENLEKYFNQKEHQ